MIEIPDASVAVKWFVRAGETGLAAADEVRKRIIADPERFAVPTLFLYEVLAVFCRRALSDDDVKENMRLVWALGIPVVCPDEKLMALAAEIAFDQKLTAYDATYVALAKHLGATWLTFDAEAHRRVTRLGVARLLS